MLVREILEGEFRFVAEHGEEFRSLPDWKQQLTYLIEAKGMEYKVAVINFELASRKTRDYISAAQKVVSGNKISIPPVLRPYDVQQLLDNTIRIKTDIEELIKIYNAG